MNCRKNYEVSIVLNYVVIIVISQSKTADSVRLFSVLNTSTLMGIMQLEIYLHLFRGFRIVYLEIGHGGAK